MQTVKYKTSINSAFTLVEVSIVILVISLLVSGVMAGQSLIKSSQLQNVVKEIREYDTAIKQFKDKFKYYPGDFPSANTYWDAAHGNAVSGDGNWQISTGSGEDLQFWKQLALAGFISVSYTGATTGTPSIGTNSPKSLYENGGYQPFYASSYYSTSGNLLMLGSLVNNSSGYINGVIMSPNDAYIIDTKIDDGMAAGGNLYVARGNGASTCVSAAYDSITATYNLTDKTISCRLFWWLDKNN